MFFFFIGGVQPKKTIIDNRTFACPRCRGRSAHVKRVDQYFSLFFIPLFPVSKGETLLECDQCGYRESLEGHPPRPSRPPRPQQSPPLQSAPREEHSIRCPHCGEPIKEDFNYCPRCGRKV